MSSLRHAYLLGFFVVLGALAGYGKMVKTWDGPAMFGAIEVTAIAAVGVLQRSPRDAAKSDAPKPDAAP